MERKKMRSSIMLVLTALIWGMAFVAQSVGMEYVGAFTFNAARFFMGGLVLIPCIFWFKRMRKGHNANRLEAREQTEGEKREKRRFGIIGGICCGMALFAGSSFQQFGMGLTSVGKAGFITALYIIIVPLLGIFMKKKVGVSVWISVAIATLGMYLLCMSGGNTSISRGDLYILICSVCFSFHILIIDYFSPKADGVFLSCIQFFTAGIISLLLSLALEHPTAASLAAAWAPLLYAGVMSCGVAYTLQVVAQKDTSPVIASLILSLESVFSLLAGWVILGESLGQRELLGCVLVFAAILLAQLPKGLLRRKGTSSVSLEES